MARLLIVHHSPTPTVQSLTDAVVAGANDDEIPGVEVVVRQALEANAADVLAADGYLLGATANFGTWRTKSPTERQCLQRPGPQAAAISEGRHSNYGGRCCARS